MKTINITIDAQGTATSDSDSAGYFGEHNSLTMKITVGTYFGGCEYYRMVIDGGYSDKLTPSDGIISYTVPQTALRPPAIRCQLAGYKTEDGIPLLISRSRPFDLKVGASPTAEIPINPLLADPFETKISELANAVSVNHSDIEKLETVFDGLDANVKKAETGALNASLYSSMCEKAAQRAETAAKALEDLNAEDVKYSTDVYTLSADNSKAALDELFQKSADFDSVLASFNSKRVLVDDSHFTMLSGSNMEEILMNADNSLVTLRSDCGKLKDLKQAKITAKGILKGAGNGSISAAAAGVDYISPSEVDDQISDTSQNPVQNSVVKKYIDGMLNPSSFKYVQEQVRLGRGPAWYPVGYEFTTHDSVTGRDIIWVVRGHDTHKASDESLKHTMTLETKYLYSDANGLRKAIQFDAAEAFYYAENGLAAGTYNFTVANQDWCTTDNGKTFKFTLKNAVPSGGQLVFDATYTASFEGKSVKVFASNTATSPTETATITEGSDGTSLGTTDGESENVNHMHRIFFGSNNYAQSAMRQWLNSDAEAGAVWSPTNKYDRPPVWATMNSGFLRGLPSDFLEVVKPVEVTCHTNSVYETKGYDGVSFTANQTYTLYDDRFFLLSAFEVSENAGSAVQKDGELLEYYKNLTDTERIKRDENGTEQYTWLRSSYCDTPHSVRVIMPSGALYRNLAYYGHSICPACVIA